jgi:hypothetical protein
MNNDKVFLSNIKTKIEDGEFDKDLNLPFMTKQLFYAAIKNKLNRKIEKGGSPVLTDSEMKDCIEDVKETAINTFMLFMNNGILVKTDDGYKFSSNALKAARNLDD